MIVVEDKHYATAINKLKDAGFVPSVPNRNPPPEIMESHPNPQQLLEEINAGYKRFDRSCAVFNYPRGDPTEENLQLYLFPNSFTHLPLENNTYPLNGRMKSTAKTMQFDIYGNIFYPLEPTLVESFVKAAIDEENKVACSSWSMSLTSLVSQMAGYLEVNNDILDHSSDEEAAKWFSTNFGRIREAKFGPLDYRISKRIGSGKRAANRYAWQSNLRIDSFDYKYVVCKALFQIQGTAFSLKKLFLNPISSSPR
ncbi:hypothetical protein FQN57_005989 [Myotisia sp. PD_48]|nr:hypothetical protein FQN57_005989 [Myotisia sp. PD_48]